MPQRSTSLSQPSSSSFSKRGLSRVARLDGCIVSARQTESRWMSIMCAEDEEHERLMESESPSKAVSSKWQGLTLSKQCSIVLTFIASTAFIAGYLAATHNELPLFGSNSTSSSNVQTANIISNVRIVNEREKDPSDDGHSPLFNASFADYLTSGMKARLAEINGTRKSQYVYDSPYEERWPGSDQPYWARKTIPFNRFIENDKQICFVHVGKAGGSTVGCMLGFSLHCDSDSDIKGLLPIVTTHAFHRGANDCYDDAAYYLFVVRDPLARILSDMNYERPNMTKADPFGGQFLTKELYHDCNFWTLEDLAQNGILNRQNDQSSRRCRSRAFKALTGTGKFLTHAYFNYQYYTQFVFKTEDNDGASTIPENANLMVIRNSHMMDDYNKINELIGGQPGALQPSDIPTNNAHAKNSRELYLSEKSTKALCWVLCNEIQVYKDIIRRAINLDDDDFEESMEELRQACPKEAVGNKCFEDRPNIRRKIDDKRGEFK